MWMVAGSVYRMAIIDSELGAFLRANRARLDPTDVGLAGGGAGRRVPGLRREEVAVLAGVSADYYARLEQGRERGPSPQVIAAIGRALRLDSDSRAHLYRLAGLNPRAAVDASRDSVHPSLIHLLDAFPRAASYVLGPAFDVLAANSIARALLAPFAPELNMPRILFTHPDAKSVFAEWDVVTKSTVHALRLNAAHYADESSITHLVNELSYRSPQFRALWAEQAVGGLARAFKVFVHPEAGRIELTYQTFDVRDAPGQQLLVGTPQPGSRSEEAIAYLSFMAAPSEERSP
jgi:transcriptional regulator with XRE-family HTH domain